MASFPQDPTHGEVQQELRRVRTQVFEKASQTFLTDYLEPEINNTPTGPRREALTELQIHLLRVVGFNRSGQHDEVEGELVSETDSAGELEAGDGKH